MYRILPLTKHIKKQIGRLRPAEKQKLRQAFSDIEANPYWASGGKIDRFRGDLAHWGWHYELSYGYRIHYQIHEDRKEIEITYVGPHPKY